VIRGTDGRIASVRYVLARHKAANGVGPDRERRSRRPGVNGVAKICSLEFLDCLADLVPSPWKHRHRYHGVFASNHKLRRAVPVLAIGDAGKRGKAAHDGNALGGPVAAGCCDTSEAAGSHDTSRGGWAKLLRRV